MSIIVSVKTPRKEDLADLIEAVATYLRDTPNDLVNVNLSVDLEDD